MRVRVRLSDTREGVWIIEVRRWWWPFWKYHDNWSDHDVAVMFARRLLRPEITEVK